MRQARKKLDKDDSEVVENVETVENQKRKSPRNKTPKRKIVSSPETLPTPAVATNSRESSPEILLKKKVAIKCLNITISSDSDSEGNDEQHDPLLRLEPNPFFSCANKLSPEKEKGDMTQTPENRSEVLNVKEELYSPANKRKSPTQLQASTPKKAAKSLKFEEVKTPTRISPRKRTPTKPIESPPPIKVYRQQGMKKAPSWTMFERGRLLDHILKFMEQPTVPRDKLGKRKRDMERNVLPRVSPSLAEKPLESRTLEEITVQYYK